MISFMIALKGWPILGYIPHMFKAVGNKGMNNFYHNLQQKLGPVYKMKGLGTKIDIVYSLAS